jgi:hypothetical protein
MAGVEWRPQRLFERGDKRIRTISPVSQHLPTDNGKVFAVYRAVYSLVALFVNR